MSNGVLSEENFDKTAIATTFSCYCVLKPFRNHMKLQTSSLLNNCFTVTILGLLFSFAKAYHFSLFKSLLKIEALSSGGRK